ncbi:MAG: hypothetical protein NC417_04195 [Candidatus Gastranaerophilales bacterium]|nr:hypothetical protein [Candidatus Gastranaerophilales bacterium]
MKKRILAIAPYIPLGLVLLLLICLNLFFHDHWLDSDMAAEMIFSRLLAEKGHIFASQEWYYSTEFRFLYTHLVMGPLFRISDNWHVIRMVTNLVTYALMTASCFYVMKPLKMRRGSAAIVAAVLLLPFSETMMHHMEMGNTYPWHVILVFFVFGMYLRLAQRRQKGLSRWVLMAGYLALSVVCGVSGVRYLLALQCPLLMAAFWYLLISEEYQKFRADFGVSGDVLTLGKKIWKSERAYYLYYALLGAAGSVAGYGINVLWVSRQYIFQTYEGTNFIAVYQGVLGERLQNAFGSLIMLFGYIPDRSVLSLRGIVTIISFVMLAILVYCNVRVYKEQKGQRFFVELFFVTAFFLNVFVFVFTTSTMVPRYYLTLFAFALLGAAFYFEQRAFAWDKLVIGIMIVLCLFVSTGKTVLSFVTTDKNADKRAVAAFLEERYDFGYATYWNGNIVTELTGGKVEVANILNPEGLQYFTWSTPMKYYREGYHEGTVFLLLETAEAAEYVDAKALEIGRKVYEDAGYVVYEYADVETLLSCRPDDGQAQVR